MKATTQLMVSVLGLGMLAAASVSVIAQETGAATAPGAVTAPVDNGARPGDSHVRIVRLSEVRGTMGLDRGTGAGFEQTMQNMPIVEGEKLQTAAGFAEVEFEDNSTLRLTPNSRVDFPLLALRSTGAKASTMKVLKGTVYVTTESTKENEFVVEAGAATLVVAPSTHLRLDFDGESALLSVFKGSVEVQRGMDTTIVDKKETLSLGAGEMTVGKKIAEEPYDAWDKQSMEYHEAYANANSFAGGGNAFGLSDLNYYGSFINSSCGQMWQPYMVSAAWNPYSNGVWAMYPGAGYSWVSPYPWGWLPYHSGSWGFCQGAGWGWQPGGQFYGLNNYAMNNGVVGGVGGVGGIAPGTLTKGVVHSPLRPAIMPQAPSAAAGAARPSLVMTNEKPIVFSRTDQSGNFVFQRDSAGLGVPRGSQVNLNKISNDVVRHGSASMALEGAGPGNNGASRGPMTLRPAGSSGASMADRNSGASMADHNSGASMSRGNGTGGIGQGSPSPSSSSRSGGGGPSISSPAASPMSNSGAGGGGVRGGTSSSPK